MNGSPTPFEQAEEILLNVCQSNLQTGTVTSARSRLHQKCLALKNAATNLDVAKLAVYFADDVMNRQANEQKLVWSSIEMDPDIFGSGQGMTAFYTVASQYLGKSDPEGKAMQELAFKCLALGFIGAANDLEPKNLDLMRALKDTLKIKEIQSVTFAERDHQPDERQLWKKPTRWLRWIGIAAAAAMFGLVLGYVQSYLAAEGQVTKSLETIQKKYATERP
ncbi:MAG: DotU family type IV/VI secretion system protein [Verrucomicrobiales bacterium]|nr:DotU family type IV/VI secretion system protein [Verrucomicrobiales bacterium]